MLLPATGIYLREDSQSCADTCIRIRRLSTNVRNSQSVFLIVVD